MRDPLDPPQRFEPSGESPLDMVFGAVLLGVLLVLWLRDPGDRLLEFVVATVAILAIGSLVLRRSPRAGVRLNLVLTSLLLIVGLACVAVRATWWLTIITAIAIVPSIGFRLGALFLSFKRPELLEED